MKKEDLVLFAMTLGAVAAIRSCQSSQKPAYDEIITQTTVGKRFIERELYTKLLFSTKEMYIINYNGNYIITNSLYFAIGRYNEPYCITDDVAKRGKNQCILANDIIPLRTITDQELLTMVEAYEKIDELLNNNEDLHFPEIIETQNFTLNENPIEVSKKYFLNNFSADNEKNYKTSDLYLVYHNQNIYLCRESATGSFYIADDNIALNSPNFEISSQAVRDTNLITVDHVVNFARFLEGLGINELSRGQVTLRQAYQILETGLNITGNPFLKKEHSCVYQSQFTDQQNANAYLQISKGMTYLDDYHTNPYLGTIYKVSDIKLVEYNGMMLLVDHVEYNAEDSEVILQPISSSGRSRPIQIFYTEDNFKILDFDALLKKDLFKGDTILFYARDYYQALADYLIRYGSPFDEKNQRSLVDNSLDYVKPSLSVLGENLNLKLSLGIKL